MSHSKFVTGAACILGALAVTRVAIHFSHPTPGMTPQQIWRSMSWVLRTVVIAAWVLFVHGWWILVKAVWARLGSKKPAGRDDSAPRYKT